MSLLQPWVQLDRPIPFCGSSKDLSRGGHEHSTCSTEQLHCHFDSAFAANFVCSNVRFMYTAVCLNPLCLRLARAEAETGTGREHNCLRFP